MTHPSSSVLKLAVLVLIAMLAFEAIGFIHCSKYYGRHTGFQFREKPRATRGFKSVALSTARGFGKRDPSFKVALPDLESPPFNAPRFAQKDSFPVDWLIGEMQNDPELMRTLIKKFIDTNQDDEISAEELIRPDIRVMKPSNTNNFNFEDEQ
ncbi:allatotropins-like [Planococcus citri]|uniref:allatotropins-like n=1 Tax=Planococcus citri TaxID=170843 RepID=UPI0031F96991